MTLRAKVLELLGTWSVPPDLPAKVAAVLAAVFAIAAVSRGGGRLLLGLAAFEDEDERVAERRRFLGAAALAAAMVSVAYVSSYLRGGPRIVDATTYFLQGRALSHGDLAWTPLEPSASFRGRFLLFQGGPDDGSLGGIFPPGYPLLLAFGFALGVPMIVGPLLAGALVYTTYQLARAIAEEAAPRLAEPVARGAALLSICCAALRYHTADTMSHAASALGIGVALVSALRARAARDRGATGWAVLAGLATGYVFATRPVSAIAISIVVAALLATRAPRLALPAFAALAPGVALLCLSQRAVTGAWLTSTQRMYYALSDGPPGCFRWGFGEGTGCVYEHGDFVAARLASGYGLVEAAGTTLRRLHKHVLDVANLEPLALGVLAPALLRRSSPAVRAATALVVLQVLAYVPFYFDGDYPGGGARFFADVLPVEHALVMVGGALLAERVAARRSVAERVEHAPRIFARGALWLLALALAGFAVHASYEHGKLRDRDGGVPMFEPDVLARASLTRGLVFVGTDHGFALGHDPAARTERGVVVARRRDDARDWLLYDALGRPPTYRYDLDATAPSATSAAPNAASATPNAASTARLTPWSPPDPGRTLRFEAEAEWPALAQDGGFAAPAWTNACASGGRALVLTPAEPSGRARATIAVPVPSSARSHERSRWAVEIHMTRPLPSSAHAEGSVTIEGERWSWGGDGAACAMIPAKTVALQPPYATLTLEAVGGPVALDYVTLRQID